MMARDPENLEAKPIQEILCMTTREVVGWLYLWEDGRIQALWKDGPKADVIPGKELEGLEKFHQRDLKAFFGSSE